MKLYFLLYHCFQHRYVDCSVLSGAINVSIPRLGYYLGKKDYESYKNLLNQGAALFYFLIIPTSIGMMV